VCISQSPFSNNCHVVRVFNQFAVLRVMNKRTLKTVTVNVGKRGLTENLINEINLQLEKHGIVKVRMLRSFRTKGDRRKLAEEIESKIRGELVDLRGFVLTIKR